MSTPARRLVSGILNAAHFIAREDQGPSGDHHAPLVNKHFANLDIKRKSMVLNNDGTINDSDFQWVPTSTFPGVADDFLLYLSMMGGPKRPAFNIKVDGTRISFAEFFAKLQMANSVRAHQLRVDNAIQTSNSGMELEAVLATTMCVASHANGVSGIALSDFVCELVFELGHILFIIIQATLAGNKW